MIVFKDKTDCIEKYEAIGSALDESLVEDLDQVTQELVENDLDVRWVVLDLLCRVCGHEQTALVPYAADLDNLECINCENHTSQEKEDVEWWQE